VSHLKRWGPMALAVVTLVVLGALHPNVRFVDFIAFCDRARGLPAGLVDPLYPLGYVAALRALTEALGNSLLAGRALSLLGGGLLIHVLSARLGHIAAACVGVTLGFLAWGSTEGTDMLAAALAISAVLQKDWKAGALLGAALMVRYSALAAVPVVLFSRDWKRWLALVVCTAPHWAVALVTGEALLPDQSANLQIGAQGAAPLLSADTLRRFPMGFWLAFRHMEPVAWVGALGLIIGCRSDPRARKLLAFAVLHLALLAVVFSRPRLALPATLAMACGGAWLLRWRWSPLVLLLPLAFNLRIAWLPVPQELTITPAVNAAAHLEGIFLSSNPWFHGWDEGWVTRARSLREAGPPPTVTPDTLSVYAKDHGIDHIVLDGGRVMATWPRLEPMLKGQEIEGLERIDIDAPGWRVYRVVR
jgi:hypothetical protein